ncbi:signal peptidase I [Lapillicoccus jejuensis]|uniref:Signal peptidase I n=1 Tax=Lapillicoccus jejuensis TaxID=402171 RepID=A0A542E3H8_9MICO|nr:signal peptidase I [Lapillicoccus jejuensis]TQJ09836.1 signal peptidase I [Lapillicoccus jejuensis]
MGRSSGRRRLPYVALVVLLVLLVARAAVLPAFVVPSGSMEPTLQPGDRVLVLRLPGGAGAGLHRGDVVVFDGRRAFLDQPDGTPLQRLGREVASFLGVGAGTDYVKRVVGLPGDRVRCCDSAGRLVVDGVPVDEPYLFPGDRPSEVGFDVAVPPGRVWVMGDHRRVSTDSRGYLGAPGGGLVPLDDVVGQVVVRYWPPGRAGTTGGPGPLSDVPAR